MELIVDVDRRARVVASHTYRRSGYDGSTPHERRRQRRDAVVVPHPLQQLLERPLLY